MNAAGIRAGHSQCRPHVLSITPEGCGPCLRKPLATSSHKRISVQCAHEMSLAKVIFDVEMLLGDLLLCSGKWEVPPTDTECLQGHPVIGRLGALSLLRLHLLLCN